MPNKDPTRIVRCDVCGRSEPVSALDLTGYLRSGWPRCCGQVMTYFTESERPHDGTRFTHKCPVCGFEWAVTLPAGVEVAVTSAQCERCHGQTPAIPPT